MAGKLFALLLAAALHGPAAFAPTPGPTLEQCTSFLSTGLEQPVCTSIPETAAHQLKLIESAAFILLTTTAHRVLPVG